MDRQVRQRLVDQRAVNAQRLHFVADRAAEIASYFDAADHTLRADPSPRKSNPYHQPEGHPWALPRPAPIPWIEQNGQSWKCKEFSQATPMNIVWWAVSFYQISERLPAGAL